MMFCGEKPCIKAAITCCLSRNVIPFKVNILDCCHVAGSASVKSLSRIETIISQINPETKSIELYDSNFYAVLG